MRIRQLPRHDALQQATRIPWIHRGEQAVPLLELAALFLLGGIAACALVFLDWGLRIPGHAILRAVFPMVFGLALVPRRGAGSVMGLGALCGLGWIQLGGHASPGWGATTSLLLTGPFMDAALWSAKHGGRVYLGFALAGLATNVAAFAIRGATKYLGTAGAGGRPFSGWWPEAIVTYALCGLLAGIISAAVWFQAGGRDKNTQDPTEPVSP